MLIKDGGSTQTQRSPTVWPLRAYPVQIQTQWSKGRNEPSRKLKTFWTLLRSGSIKAYSTNQTKSRRLLQLLSTVESINSEATCSCNSCPIRVHRRSWISAQRRRTRMSWGSEEDTCRQGYWAQKMWLNVMTRQTDHMHLKGPKGLLKARKKIHRYRKFRRRLTF